MKINKQNISKMIIGATLITSLSATPALAQEEKTSINSTSFNYKSNDYIITDNQMQIRLVGNTYHIYVENQIIEIMKYEELQFLLSSPEEYVSIANGIEIDKKTLESKINLTQGLTNSVLVKKDDDLYLILNNNGEVVREMSMEELLNSSDKSLETLVYIEVDKGVFISFNKLEIRELMSSEISHRETRSIIVTTGLVIAVTVLFTAYETHAYKKSLSRKSKTQKSKVECL